MALFKVDRASASVKTFDKPGTYTVEVVKTEASMTSKGDAQVRLVLKSDDGCVTSDNFLNRDNCWWRVNALLAAVPALKIDEGTEIDFTKRDAFADFLDQFKGHRVQVKLEEETYVKDGETRKTLRVRKYLPAQDTEEAF